MKMGSTSFVSAFNVGSNSVLYAKVDWIQNETDLFHIQIYDKENWWTGRFSKEFSERYRERTEEDENEYQNNVKTSLMRKNNSFVYEFVSIAGDLTASKFSWKKIYKDSEGDLVTIVHGSVPVHKNEEITNTDIIVDFLLDENTNLKKKIDDYEMKILIMNGELEQSRIELEKFINAKKCLETSVYGKFIHLLNNKKRRIKLLEQNLHELDNSTHSRSEVD